MAPKKTTARALPVQKPPAVFIPFISIHQTDGSVLMKPGKAVVISDVVRAREAAKILHISQRSVENQCALGLFVTAHKPGGRPRSPWMIARAEVEARKERPAE
jgi:hypothetical protein